MENIASERWKGEARRKLKQILAALGAQEIASDLNETVYETARTGPFGALMSKVKSTQAHEVWVFTSDLERGRAATERFTEIHDHFIYKTKSAAL
jgi:hypothetical protein